SLKVGSDVTALGWDSRFIICEQTERDAESTQRPARQPSLCSWWVVDTVKQKRFGPVAQTDLPRIAEELRICPPIRVYHTEAWGRDGKLTNTRTFPDSPRPIVVVGCNEDKRDGEQTADHVR